MKLSENYLKALQFAYTAHDSQIRKGSEVPYISHLMSVSAIVMENNGTEEQAIAGLLHDAVEDQGGLPMLDTIRRIFGEKVAGIVWECSDSHEEPKPPWKQRKDAYIAAIEDKSEDSILVSLADKFHNARSILSDYQEVGEKLWERFTGKKDGTLWYYRELVAAFKKRTDSVLLGELEEVVTRLHEVSKQ